MPEQILTMDYRAICEDLKTRIFDRANNNFLYNNLLFRFVYEGLPIPREDVPFLELFLLTRGACAMWKDGEDYVITPCERVGNIDAYGRGKDLICTTLNGKQKKFVDYKNNPEVVYIRNNKLSTPDLLIEKDGESLTEIIKSIDCCVSNTRYTDVVLASDENEKVLIENAMDARDKGKIAVVVSDNFTEDGETIRHIGLTDPARTDILQYLNRAYDDVLRRFWNRAGMEVCTTTKLAQQTKDEVTAGHNARMVESYEMLAEREEAIEAINAKFGLSVSVDFSDPWKREVEDARIEESREETARDEAEDEVEEGGNDNEVE